MAKCPNCDAQIVWDTAKCEPCGAVFGEGASWHPQPESRDEREQLKTRYPGAATAELAVPRAGNPYAPPQSAVADAPADAKEPRGIGGWLLLPVIGLFVFPIRLVVSLFTDYMPIFQTGAWSVLTAPGSPRYHALWGPLLAGEIIFNLAFLALDIWLLVLLFSKDWRFPKVFVGFAVLNLVFILLDSILGNQIPAVAAASGDGSAKEIGRGLIMVAVWVPYMLVSQRVKNTFVKPATA